MLRTTIAGSLPKPAWLARPERLWAPWRCHRERSPSGQRDAVLIALKDAGSRRYRHGRPTASSRAQHFVHGFLEKLDGIDFGSSDDRHPGRPLQGRGADRDRPDRAARAPSTGRGPLGAGPHRAQAQVHPSRADDDRRHASPTSTIATAAQLAMAFARLINEEARELVAARLDVLQLDEPAFNVYMGDVAEWGIAALTGPPTGLACTTAVHICYGYGIKANIDWKPTLGARMAAIRGDLPAAGAEPHRSGFAGVREFEGAVRAARAADGQGRAGRLHRRGEPTIETPEEVAATIRRALEHVPPERLYPCTNCGMVPLSRDVARGKLHALGAGARLVRAELAGG